MAEGKTSGSDSKPTTTTEAPSSRAGCARNALLGLALVLVVVYVFTQASGSGGGSDEALEERQRTVTTEPRLTTTLAPRPDPVEADCPAEDGSSDRVLQFSGPPPMCIDPQAGYVATVETNRGDFEITLDPSRAPQAVNSFVFLARWHFYDGVGFHRIHRDFLAQAGDPFDPDIGGADAGYTLPEEPPTAQPYYPVGTVAMANLYPEPDTTGSEFFVVTGQGASQLGPNWSPIGTVTAGEEVVDAINATGTTDGVGFPTDITVIESVTVEEA